MNEDLEFEKKMEEIRQAIAYDKANTVRVPKYKSLDSSYRYWQVRNTLGLSTTPIIPAVKE